MKSFFRKYIGDKQFYKMVMTVTLPIIIQNGISAMVSMLDNIMVGQLGTEQMSGVAIVNRLFWVFTYAYMVLYQVQAYMESNIMAAGIMKE